ncbi:MAG: hypothetical protein FJX74_07405, partial [Armatimonadetes bacterium]|nr:hypothetical protein [Armatimonadota bacterium]
MRELACGLALMMTACATWAEVGLRIGPESATEWSAQVSWQGNPSEACSVSVRDAALDFCVPEPNRGMKWVHRLDPADVFAYRWLVVRYRMVSYAPGPIDYLLWCNADTGEDGLRLLPPHAPEWD